MKATILLPPGHKKRFMRVQVTRLREHHHAARLPLTMVLALNRTTKGMSINREEIDRLNKDVEDGGKN